MTQTTTARQAIADAAQAAGWSRTVGHLTDTYRRGEVQVTATFGTRGGLTFGEIHGPGVSSDVTGSRGKRETVPAWLAREDERLAPADSPSRVANGVAASLRAAVQAPAFSAATGTPADEYSPTSTAGMMTRIVELERDLAASRAQEQRTEAAREALALQLVEVNGRAARLEGEVRDLATRGRKLVRALVAQRDGQPGIPILSLSASRAFGLLADAVGEDVPPPPRGGLSADLVLVDEVVPALVNAPAPSTAREALELDARGVDGRFGHLGTLLPGDSSDVREYVPGGPVGARTRCYGVLVRRPDGREVFVTAHGDHGQPVPVDLVLPYLAAVRGAGFPAPARRLALLEAVRATHRR